MADSMPSVKQTDDTVPLEKITPTIQDKAHKASSNSQKGVPVKTQPTTKQSL
jgi:hypothetical protein